MALSRPRAARTVARAPTIVSQGGPSQVTKTPSEAPQFSSSVYSHSLSEAASKSSQTWGAVALSFQK